MLGLQTELGLEDRPLTAHLYKLLVYEKGSFFLPHRDGEKLDRMVATLVIGLPSVHEGGELIVSHEDARREFTFSGAASGHELSYAAFYADCEHEVRPVRSGYRLRLVYNVALAKERRRHLHNVIDSNGSDVTHVTERRGRPYTLVCTKTTASYEAACEVHERDAKNLQALKALERKLRSST